jgi:uncharacterized protein
VRLFLDTNVPASAVATRGLCSDVLREVFAAHELVVSAQVLGELRRVLSQKLRVDRELTEDFVSLVREEAVLAIPGGIPDVTIQDQDDLPVLSAALSSGADVFVTGDKELLDLGRIDRLSIVSPRQFWEKLKAGTSPGRRGRRRRRR